MKTSPSFLTEIKEQIKRAQSELASAQVAGDSLSEEMAASRLRDLRELRLGVLGDSQSKAHS